MSAFDRLAVSFIRRFIQITMRKQSNRLHSIIFTFFHTTSCTQLVSQSRFHHSCHSLSHTLSHSLQLWIYTFSLPIVTRMRITYSVTMRINNQTTTQPQGRTGFGCNLPIHARSQRRFIFVCETVQISEQTFVADFPERKFMHCTEGIITPQSCAEKYLCSTSSHQ